MARTGENGWCLEVARGQDVGKVFRLAAGSSLLGNGLGGAPGIDLAKQEGSSPRRMAPRQAEVVCAPGGLTLRDLDSPGGTFVNRQRILSGQSQRLADGDLIQLGAVQLRVTRVPIADVKPPSPSPPSPTVLPDRQAGLPKPFALRNGSTCRTWDDFLTVSSRDWPALRDEVVSGRLSAFLQDVGRDDLKPLPSSTKSADERLDDWLALLPATRPVLPDLEVHPERVVVKANAGGGRTIRKVTVTSTGYRLLRVSHRIEPPGVSWLRVPSSFSAGPILIPESTEIPLEVEIPESVVSPLSAFLVVESNGGTRRVEVRLESQAWDVFSPGHLEGGEPTADSALADVLAGWSSRQRVYGGAIAGVSLRLLIAVGDRLTWLDSPSAPGPSLVGGAVLMALLGGIASTRFARRNGEPRDIPWAAFAGAFAGMLIATLAVATCRTLEPISNVSSYFMLMIILALWASLGAVAGKVSCWSHAPLERSTKET
ncbi:MAG: hypothetical protein NVSMB9_10730 [Isosphaeraceae bacterium]